MPDPAMEGAAAPIAHGGNLTELRRLFPDAPESLIDLSTGINPHSYPIPSLPAEVFTRLPEPGMIARLEALAAGRYGAPSAANVVAAPGTQILLPLIASLVDPGQARVLGPTYAEHVRAARLAGHAGREVHSLAALAGARLAVVVNPNNPDGRVIAPAELVAAARRTDGLLVVDEAFGEAAPDGMSVAPDGVSVAGVSVAPETNMPRLLVLRSFGKFHGLAGVRLGFAIASVDVAARLRARLGPWAVSGPAAAIGMQALADRTWAVQMRSRLAADAVRLDQLLHSRGLAIRGGTMLFRLVQTKDDLFHRLGRAGIMIRPFADRPGFFRLGVPPHEAAWMRLSNALPEGSRS